MREVLWKILSAEENMPDGLTVQELEAPVGLEFTIYEKETVDAREVEDLPNSCDSQDTTL
jgi:hypothetical protein